MVDIATLGIRVESDQVATADTRLDDLTASAGRAEGAVERTGRAMATTDAHARNMATAMDMANRRSQALAQSGLNLGRQFTDVGVTLAMGMNPFMVLLQQGPQIIDAFQVAALQMGTTVRGSMVAMGVAIWTAMAPLLPFIAAIGAAVGAMAIAFGFATRAASQSIGDLTAEMGLSQAELKRLEDQGVSTTTTMGDVFRGLGTTIKEGFFAVFGDELDKLGRSWTSFLDDAQRVVGGAVRNISAGFLAALYAIRAGWSMLPAALGDIAFTTANAVLAGVERMINVGVELINDLIRRANRAADAIPGMEAFIPELDRVRFDRVTDQYAGGARNLFATIGRESAIGAQEGLTLLDRVAARGLDNIRASGQARLGNALGDRDTNRTAGERVGRAIAEGVAAGARERWGGLEPERIFAIPTPQRVEIERLVPPEITTDLDLLIARLEETADAAKRMGQGLSSAFGEPGRIAADLLSITSTYNRQVAEVIATEKDATKSAQMRRDLQVQAYGDIAGAAKGFFEQNSAGYRAMEAVERGYRAFQLISSAAAIAQGWIEASQSVAQATAKTTADTAAGGAKMFAQLGAFAFPAVAAMVAVLAGLGARGGGGGAAPTLPSVNTGTGTVLGAPDEASQSIANSLEMAERYYDRDLRFSSEMVQSLRAIEDNISVVTTSIARQVGAGGAFDTAGLNLGTTTGGGFLGIGQTTRTRDLVDQGLQLASGSLADLIANGVRGATFQTIQNTKTKSGFLGIGGGTTTWNTETTGAMDALLGQQLGQLLASLRDGIAASAAVIGVEGAEAVLDNFRVQLGRISFNGMSSAEISDALRAVFSAVGDQMAGALVPGLQAFQRAGEGLMETLTRLAVEYQAVDDTLASIGMTFRTVGLESIEARSRLVQLSGGLEEFTSQADFFANEFLTEAQRIAPIQAAVNAELARLGLSSDTTREQFAALVMGIDVSTEAGASLYAALMRLAPGMDAVLDYTEQLTGAVWDMAQVERDRRQLEWRLMELTGEASRALIDRRHVELQAMHESLRPLQERIWSLEDAARAEAEAQRVLDQRRSLEVRLMEATGDSAGVLAARREAEMASMDESLRSLLGLIYAAEDANRAMMDAQRASEEATRAYEQRVNDARSALSQAYQRESSALEGIIDRFGGFGESLRAFRRDLDQTLGGGTTSTAGLRAEFERIGQLARLGDETALGQLQGAGQAFIDASRQSSTSSAAFRRDVALVTSIVDQALGTVDRTVLNAQRELDLMTAQVDGLLQVNDSVLSVRDAILGLSSLGIRTTAFASGGIFTSPTVFGIGRDMGIMAEAGPEAIVPLVRGPDGLGVSMYGANDNSELKADIASLSRDISELKAAMVQTALNTGKNAREAQKTRDLIERLSDGGDALRTTEAA